MHYAEFAPSPRFRAIVDRYWILEGAGTGQPDAVIPDGCVEIIFHYGDPFFHHSPDGRVDRQASSLVAGQIAEPVLLAWRGQAGVAAIRLRPGAASAGLRLPAADITGQILDLESVSASTRDLREQLAAAPDDHARIVLLEGWLGHQRVGSPRADVAAAIEALQAGVTDIESISAYVGLQRRQLERLFRRDVGLPPKMLGRIFRLQRALAMIRRGDLLTDVALACGYYDQAHMALDFRRLAEMSPSAWSAHSGELTALMARPLS